MLHDSGERKTNELGSQTDPSHADVAMELLSPYSLRDLAVIYGAGAKKYAPRNWEKGIKFSICVGKLQRHLQQYLMGRTEEDHLNAVGFWWHALAHYREMIKLNLLPASLDDLPKYEQQTPDGTSPGYEEKCECPSTGRGVCGSCLVDIPAGTMMVYNELGDIVPFEDEQDEEYGEFTIKKPQIPGKGWYVIFTRHQHHKRGGTKIFLHKDCKLHGGTGYRLYHKFAEAPGYFKSKAYAKHCIRYRRLMGRLFGGDYVAG